MVNKNEIAQDLNSRLGTRIHWTNLNKEEIKEVQSMFDRMVYKDDITSDTIKEITDDPLALAMEIIEEESGNRTREAVGNLLALLREEGFGRGGLVSKKFGAKGKLLKTLLTSNSEEEGNQDSLP